MKTYLFALFVILAAASVASAQQLPKGRCWLNVSTMRWNCILYKGEHLRVNVPNVDIKFIDTPVPEPEPEQPAPPPCKAQSCQPYPPKPAPPPAPVEFTPAQEARMRVALFGAVWTEGGDFAYGGGLAAEWGRSLFLQVRATAGGIHQPAPTEVAASYLGGLGYWFRCGFRLGVTGGAYYTYDTTAKGHQKTVDQVFGGGAFIGYLHRTPGIGHVFVQLDLGGAGRTYPVDFTDPAQPGRKTRATFIGMFNLGWAFNLPL